MKTLARAFWIVVALLFLLEAWLWDRLEPIVARIVGIIPWGRIKPMLATTPVRANTLVPLERSVPMELNHPPPRVTIEGILAKVSTLLMRVGFPQSPEAAG